MLANISLFDYFKYSTIIHIIIGCFYWERKMKSKDKRTRSYKYISFPDPRHTPLKCIKVLPQIRWTVHVCPQ